MMMKSAEVNPQIHTRMYKRAQSAFRQLVKPICIQTLALPRNQDPSLQNTPVRPGRIHLRDLLPHRRP